MDAFLNVMIIGSVVVLFAAFGRWYIGWRAEARAPELAELVEEEFEVKYDCLDCSWFSAVYSQLLRGSPALNFIYLVLVVAHSIFFVFLIRSRMPSSWIPLCLAGFAFLSLWQIISLSSVRRLKFGKTGIAFHHPGMDTTMEWEAYPWDGVGSALWSACGFEIEVPERGWIWVPLSACSEEELQNVRSIIERAGIRWRRS